MDKLRRRFELEHPFNKLMDNLLIHHKYCLSNCKIYDLWDIIDHVNEAQELHDTGAVRFQTVKRLDKNLIEKLDECIKECLVLNSYKY